MLIKENTLTGWHFARLDSNLLAMRKQLLMWCGSRAHEGNPVCADRAVGEAQGYFRTDYHAREGSRCWQNVPESGRSARCKDGSVPEKDVFAVMQKILCMQADRLHPYTAQPHPAVFS